MKDELVVHGVTPQYSVIVSDSQKRMQQTTEVMRGGDKRPRYHENITGSSVKMESPVSQ